MSVRRLIVLLAVALPLAFATSAHAYVYWGDYQGGMIGRANLDGTAVEDGFIQTGGNPDAVAVTASHIYWANETGGSIGRANLDGTAVEPNFIAGINEPSAVAVSPSFIYWSSFGANEIGRANLDGTAKKLNFITGAETPCSIALDSGHIYWGTVQFTSFVGRAPLAGSPAEPEWVNLHSYAPCGLATNSANVFVADTGFLGASAHEIGRITIANKNFDPSMIGEAEGPCGLTVYGSQLFWANQGNDTIGVANTDATNVNESLVETGGNEICGVAVDSLSSPLIPPPTPPTGNEPGTGSGGASSQASPPPSPQPPTPGTLRWVKAKDDTKHGTARVSLEVNEAGVVSVTGKGILPATAQASAAGTVTVTLRAKKAKRSALKRTGKLATKVTVSFRPGDNGAPAVLAQPVTLRLTAGSKR
jgi:virginiamycin B lyase